MKLGISWKHIDRVLIAIIAVGIAVRIWKFGEIPPGLNQDEASTGYDAFALLYYGIERNGFAFPVVLPSWGNGMSLLPALLQMPFIGFFGLSVFTVRAPFLLAGILSVPLVYLFLSDMFNRKTALIGAALLAISPWHIMASRWALEANLFPFMFLLATVLFMRSRMVRHYLPVAAAVYAMSLYSYAPAYAAVSLFFLGALLIGVYGRWWRWRSIAIAVAVFVVLALPLCAYMVVNQYQWPTLYLPIGSIPLLPSMPQYKAIGNINPLAGGFFQTTYDNALTLFHMLRTQNDGLIWNVMPPYGVMYPFTSVLACAGFCLVILQCRKQTKGIAWLLLLWIGVAVVVGVLVSVNVNRINIIWIPFICCIAVAMSVLTRWKVIGAAFGAAFLIGFMHFSYQYFFHYSEQSEGAFFSGLGQALTAASETHKPVCVTGMVNMPYIFALFYGKEDPRVFVETVDYENPGAAFQSVRSFGRYTFGLDRCNGNDYGAYVVHRDERDRFQNDRFQRSDFHLYSVAIPQSP